MVPVTAIPYAAARLGVLEADDDDHYRDIQQPVNKRDIDLPGLHFRVWMMRIGDR